MEGSFTLFFAVAVGFTHAFEADHLLAVSNIVTKRKKLIHAIKDGIFWGLGHSSTILIIGILMIVGKVTISSGSFSFFEAIVGLMLVLLGVYRVNQFYQKRNRKENSNIHTQNHHMAYGIGLIHGLAGSGAMILLVMTNIQGSFQSLLYLLLFGIGSIAGMLIAAGICSLPFSKNLSTNQTLQLVLVLVSSILCIGYGGLLIFEYLSF